MKVKILRSKKIKPIIPVIGLIIEIIIFSITSKGKLLILGNIGFILNQAVFLIIAGLGVALVVSQGGLDFSQGSLLGFSSAVAAILSNYNPYLSIPGAIITGLVFGIFNGTLVTIFRIPSFIATICMLIILRGLTIFATNSGSIPISFSLFWLDSFWIRLVILIIIIFMISYLFIFTKIGRYNKAIGSNETVARFSGVPIEKMKILAFSIAGFLCGVCGFLNVIRTGVASASTGLLFETEVLTAVVLGGMPITGGSGSRIYSPIIGGFILAILNNGLIITGVNIGIQQGIKGGVFLLAVALSFNRESIVLIK